MSAPSGMPSNPFEVLELDRSATFAEVKTAYRRLARRYHPDANPHDPTALERFSALRRAYDRLKIFYQTLDVAAPMVPTPSTPAPFMAATDTRPSVDSGAVPQASERPLTTAPVVDATVAVPSGGSGALLEGMREIMQEPGLAGMGGRRAFRRTGPVRGVADNPTGPTMIPNTGALSAGESALVHTGALAGRPEASSNTLAGDGASATCVEVIYGAPVVPCANDPYQVYTLVDLQATSGTAGARRPLNLCLVLDHSSSMLRGGKINRLKAAVHALIDDLEADDYLSIVSFGDTAAVLLPAQQLRDRTTAREAIEELRCSGGTNYARGLASGVNELSRYAARALSHLILLTDGPTSGDEAPCLRAAIEVATLQGSMTVYGLGPEWSTALLDTFAGLAGGDVHYLPATAEIAPVFIDRVQALRATALCGVTLAVQPAARGGLVRATVVDPYLRPLDGCATEAPFTAYLGDLRTTDTQRLLLEWTLDRSRPGPVELATLTVTSHLPGRTAIPAQVTLPLTLTVDRERSEAQAPDLRVVAAARQVTAQRLCRQAWQAVDNGDVAQGAQFMRRAARHLETVGHQQLLQSVAAAATAIESGEGVETALIRETLHGLQRGRRPSNGGQER